MTTRDYTANVISATKVVPDGNFKNSKASGVWDINEALDLIKGGNWPNAANFNPSAFVDGLFQCHLYTGTASNRDITNNVDLTKGGLVWTKARTNTGYHHLFDTERGVGKAVFSNDNLGETTYSTSLTAFNNNGFSLGNSSQTGQNEIPFVSWTFRKQPKFFDIVTYTGTSSTRTVSHNLGSVPGMIMIKCLSHGSSNWRVYHRGVNAGSNPEEYVLILNGQNEKGNNDSMFNDTAPTSTEFTVAGDDDVNDFNDEYVAYLFAHNDNDGGFGEPGDQDIIKCGTCSGESGSNRTINLGFEPQWIMTKSDSSGDWRIMDTMRGLLASGTSVSLEANDSAAEGSDDTLHITPTGFYVNGLPGSGDYTFVAIRRGGMQTPTTASDVFAVDSKGGEDAAPAYRGGFPVDLALYGKDQQGSLTAVSDRLRGPQQLYANLPNAEAGESDAKFDFMNGFLNQGSLDATKFGYLWKRARGYFDMVAFSGTGSNRTISHNLGVAPEMIWIKCRTSAGRDWEVYHSGIGETKFLRLNTNEAEATSSARFNNTAPSSTVFSLGNNDTVNGSGDTYISYHFATASGVSKVGSFTQSGATNVDCGFTGSTPSFILFKRTDSTGNWYLFDSARGIVAGNDKSFYLNDDSAEITNADMVDPYSGGFATTSNIADGDYIFYAIAAIS